MDSLAETVTETMMAIIALQEDVTMLETQVETAENSALIEDYFF